MAEEQKNSHEDEVIGAEETDDGQLLQRMEEIVEKAIQEEELITQNMYKYVKDETWVDKVSDKITAFSGSWPFIFGIGILIALWMLLIGQYDPFPYILLNLCISVICVLQNPFILMNQGRKEDKDRIRAEQEYIVNMKSEIEVRMLLKKQDIMLELLKKQQETLNKLIKGKDA